MLVHFLSQVLHDVAQLLPADKAVPILEVEKCVKPTSLLKMEKMFTESNTLKASLISSSAVFSSIFLSIIVRKFGNWKSPEPQGSTSIIRSWTKLN